MYISCMLIERQYHRNPLKTLCTNRCSNAARFMARISWDENVQKLKTKKKIYIYMIAFHRPCDELSTEYSSNVSALILWVLLFRFWTGYYFFIMIIYVFINRTKRISTSALYTQTFNMHLFDLYLISVWIIIIL